MEGKFYYIVRGAVQNLAEFTQGIHGSRPVMFEVINSFGINAILVDQSISADTL